MVSGVWLLLWHNMVILHMNTDFHVDLIDAIRTLIFLEYGIIENCSAVGKVE